METEGKNMKQNENKTKQNETKQKVCSRPPNVLKITLTEFASKLVWSSPVNMPVWKFLHR